MSIMNIQCKTSQGEQSKNEKLSLWNDTRSICDAESEKGPLVENFRF